MMKRFVLTPVSLFVDDELLQAQAVVICVGHIERICPQHDIAQEIAAGLTVVDGNGLLLAAGFIDTQVNGGGGVMLNDQPTLDGIDAIRHAHWSGGTTAMLPTLITDCHDVMLQAVHAVSQALGTLPGILGIHLEGPHLSVSRKGVHSAQQIRPFDAQTQALLDVLPADKYLLTVAPETLASGVIRRLSGDGIRVSAGHTAATYAQIQQALKEGLSGFTHLYNAMTPMSSREPGVVGAALEDPDSYCGIIVDGYHLHWATAKLAITTKPRGKMMLVTDAMATVGSSQDSFELYGERIYVDNGRCATEAGTLAGSALDMVTAVRNCVQKLGISLPEALRMASLYPAQFMGVADQYGHISAGFRADLVLLDDDLQLRQTWVQGELCFAAV
ncbi:MAG: N-acetylglucosamine-6-phosphate deacetylase [Thiolinea sp.]